MVNWSMSTPFENLHLRGIAHDFNNILGGIIGYAEMLVEAREGSTHRRFAQNVLSGASRATHSSAGFSAMFAMSPEHACRRAQPGGCRAFDWYVAPALRHRLQLKSRAPASPLFVIGDRRSCTES